MSRQAIADLFVRRASAIASRDLAALAALYSVDCVVESPLAAGTVQGRQAVTKVNQALFDALPDVTLTQHDLIIEGNQAVFVGTLAGTYTGGFMGLPPSGKPTSIPIIMVARIDNGEIVHERRVYDFTGMLVQIGVLKARPA